MTSLTDIGIKYNTDKVDSAHTWFNKNYMNIYEKYFEPLRDKPIRILEIGVLNGSSIKTWKEYFSNAEVHGIDIQPSCKNVEDTDTNIFIHILDCSSNDQLQMFVNKFSGYFDIILDDGSHINDITLKTFQFLYKCLKPESYYIIEDLGCAYIGDEMKLYGSNWPGHYLMNPTSITSNNPSTMLDLYRDIHIMIDNPTSRNVYQIEYLHHYPYIMILRRNDYHIAHNGPYIHYPPLR